MKRGKLVPVKSVDLPLVTTILVCHCAWWQNVVSYLDHICALLTLFYIKILLIHYIYMLTPHYLQYRPALRRVSALKSTSSGSKGRGKGEVHPITSHKAPERGVEV